MYYGFIARIALVYGILGSCSGLMVLWGHPAGSTAAFPVACLVLQTLSSAAFSRRLRSGWIRSTALHAGIAHGLGLFAADLTSTAIASLKPEPWMRLDYMITPPAPWSVAVHTVALLGLYAIGSAAWAVLVGAIARAAFGLAEPLPSHFARLEIKRSQRPVRQ